MLNLDDAITPKDDLTPKSYKNMPPINLEATYQNISIFDDDGKKKSQSTLLIEIGQKHPLFHCQNRDGYTVIGSNNAVMPLKSLDFKDHLSHEFFKLTGKGCNRTSIADALSTLESIAKFNNEMQTVFMRTAQVDDSIIIDLGCNDRHVIQVTANSWRVINKPPIKFVRRRGAEALPIPAYEGNLDLLKKYINVDPLQLPLVHGWLLCALGSIKPYPILILQGEQGTGKSTTSRVLRSLVDPSTVPLRSPPKDPRDLLVSAGNNHVVILDNLSGLSNELSDCLCRLSTGGGFDVRALFTDTEQVLIDIQKPVLINGIDDIATRPDLAERSLIINLPVIEGGQRKGEREFWQAFDQDKPAIFAGLLDLLVNGLKTRDSVVLPVKPRMADVAVWVTACLGNHDFLAAHSKNQNDANELGLEASPVGSALMTLMTDRTKWLGTPTELLLALANIAGESQTRSKAWVQSPKGLSNALKRLMPNFRRAGLTIIDSRNMTTRLYEISKVDFYPSYPSYPSCKTDKPSNDAGSVKNSMTDRHDSMTDRPDSMTDRHDSMTDSMTDMTDRHDSMTDSIIRKPSNGAGYDGYDGYKPTLLENNDDVEVF